MKDIKSTKRELRELDLQNRINEVALYEVNIENFLKASGIAKNKGLDKFSEELKERAKREKEQLNKAETMLETVKAFLKEAE